MKTKRLFIVTAIVLLAVCLLAACGPTDPTGSGDYTITFDYNYEGAPANGTQTVAEGDVVTPPSDPTRDKFGFTGWYTDAACTEKADFEYAVTEDATYYAGWVQTEATVTFDANWADGTDTAVNVEIGGTVTQPPAPTRGGYVFTGWYTDAACTTEYAFSSSVNSDITLYAGWEESAGDTVTVTFAYNYDGGDVYYSQTINSGRRVTEPADPVRDGYAFMGWYTDAACTTVYNFNTFVTTDTTLYAKWLMIHTFEAEYVDLTGMVGVGWSSSVEGIGLIDVDNMNGGASNGFYVGYMYVKGNTLTFNITSDEDVDGCVLALRLTGEGSNFTLSDTEMPVKVNGEAIEYETLEFEGVTDPTEGTRRPFSDFILNEDVSRREGNNVITIEIDNEKSLGGTMNATAPMFDCMYIYTNADIDWTEGECHTSNLDGLR